jgi:hypothetical protein
MRVIEKYDNGRTVDIEGINQHCMYRIPLGTAGAVVNTQRGPVIAIANNYALIGAGKMIHSVGQLEAFNHRVYDKSTAANNPFILLMVIFCRSTSAWACHTCQCNRSRTKNGTRYPISS